MTDIEAIEEESEVDLAQKTQAALTSRTIQQIDGDLGREAAVSSILTINLKLLPVLNTTETSTKPHRQTIIALRDRPTHVPVKA